jgi:hypothetical protein
MWCVGQVAECGRLYASSLTFLGIASPRLLEPL